MPTVRCPRCSTDVTVAYEAPVTCPSCGKQGPPVPSPSTEPAPETESGTATTEATGWDVGTSGQPAYMTGNAEGPSESLGLVALLINILLPLFGVPILGIGTLIGGRTQEGIAQLAMGVGAFILFFFGVVFGVFVVPLFMIPVAILLGLAGYVWGIVSGVDIYKEAKAREQARLAAGPPPSW